MGKLRGEKDIEATMQRLDRLTLDEGRATAAQTLEVVYGLVRHKWAIMDGEGSCPPCSSFASCIMFTFPDTDGNESSAGISRALGVFRGSLRQQADRISDWVIESMQEIVTKMNQAECTLFPIPNIHIDGWEH